MRIVKSPVPVMLRRLAFVRRPTLAPKPICWNQLENSIDAYVTIGMSEAHAVHHDWLAPYRDYYDPVIWQRFNDAENYPSEKIARARDKLKEVWAAWRQFFFNFDYLILPAAPCPAPRKADCTVELRRNILRLTAPASLGGLPVLSIPVPLPSGLTAGLQVIVPVANRSGHSVDSQPVGTVALNGPA